MMDFSPLPWGEGGESSEPSEGFLPTEPRNFGIRVELSALPIERRERARQLLENRSHGIRNRR